MRVLSVASEVFPLVKTGGLADVAGALARRRSPPRCRDAGDACRATRRCIGGADEGRRSLQALRRACSAPKRDASRRHRRRARPHRPRRAEAVRPSGQPLSRDPTAPTGRTTGSASRRFAAPPPISARARSMPSSRRRPLPRLAGRSRPGLSPHMPGPGGEVGGHHPQHRLPGPLSGRRSSPSLGLPAEAWTVEGVEYYGGVGFLKAGLHYADAITTVSPTYAEEICTPAGGMGLDGLLRARRDGRSPASSTASTRRSGTRPADPHLAATYTATTLAPPRRQQARGRGGLRPRTGRRLRSSASSAGSAGRRAWTSSATASTDWSRAAPGSPFSAPARRRSRACSAPPSPATAAASASSPAMASRCRTSSRAVPIRSSCRRASSPAG